MSHTELEEHLRSFGVTDCYVTGIATDVCVNATATHSIEIGFRTIMVNDACRSKLISSLMKLNLLLL